MTMKFVRLACRLIVFGSILFAARVAYAAPPAWPDQPPDKAFISGPGLIGEVQITDPQTLEDLRLGGIEDFNTGALPEPPKVSGEGYKITRYFYDGTFNFATLHYYPDPAGRRGLLYWEDGPDLIGDHTPYNDQWLYANAESEVVLQNQLKVLGVSMTSATTSPTASLSPLPAVWLFVLACVAVFASGLIVSR